MVSVSFDQKFQESFKKIDNSLKEKVIKQIEKIKKLLESDFSLFKSDTILNTDLKIKSNPELLKVRFARKGTREVYIGSFRLSYAYSIHENKIILLSLYHKDEQ